MTPSVGDEHGLHLTRYIFAARYANGLVLDVGCGPGYGSMHLSQIGLGRVIGVDLSPEAIRHAAASNRGPRFMIADGHHLPFPTNTFSTVVCLETIEHVSHPEAFVREVHRVLQPKGRLVLSTPNYLGESFLSHFHRHEFRHQELHTLLSDVFKSEIAWFGQREAPRRQGRHLRILRAMLDTAVAMDRFNIRFRAIPHRIRDVILRYSLGIHGSSDEIFPWKPMSLYQIAVLEKDV